MRRRMLRQVETAVLDHSRVVLGLAIVVTVAAIWLGSGIELRNSRRDIVPPDNPAQLRWNALQREYAGPSPLIVALRPAAATDEHAPARFVDEADWTPRLETAAETLATALLRVPEVDAVFHRVDPEWLLDHAPWLVDPGTLRATVDAVDSLLADDDGTVCIGSFAGLDRRITRRIDEALARGGVLPADTAAAEATRLAELLRAEADFLEDPEGFAQRFEGSMLELAGDRLEPLTPAGYLGTENATAAVFLVVSPTATDGDVDTERRFVAAVRATADRALEPHPGVAAALTGRPALTVEEMDAIRVDSRRTSGIAIVGVTLLALVAFHRRRHAVVGLTVLAMGVIWALGAVRLELGYLNLITTALVPILVGVGIDYAIHPISQYELELGEGRPRREAVRAAFRTTSAATVVSALTTALAFFCFLLVDFRGFAELGLVTGVGVLLCLAAALLPLPALLIVAGAGGRRRSARRHPHLDRLWGAQVASRLLAAPRAVVLGAALVTAVAVAVAWRVPLDTDLLGLLPRGTEALQTLDLVQESSGLDADFNIVVADDLAGLRTLESRARGRPGIDRFESVLDLLPRDPRSAADAVAELRNLLGRTRVVDPGFDAADLAAALQRLEAILAEAGDAAFVAGLGELTAAMEEARAQAERGHSALVSRRLTSGGYPASWVRRWAEGERRLRDHVRESLGRLRRGAAAAQPGVEDLPAPLQRRYSTASGKLLGFLYPTGSIYEPEVLDAFNRASRGVDPEAIGFPVLFELMGERITSGFSMALLTGGLLVFLMLMVDLRQPVQTLLAMFPVVVGVTWMLGAMWALGLAFNFANLVAVPLVLGVGIDSGVHVVHRARIEGAEGMATVVEHTGRAILIASLTTMIGFGSLAFASHRGMASLGMLLFLGVGACLLTSLVVLPNLLVMAGMPRRPPPSPPQPGGGR